VTRNGAFLSSIALVAGIAAAAHAQARAALPGWRMTLQASIDSGDNRITSMVMREMIGERNLRWEFTKLAGPSGTQPIEGMYMILDAIDSTMTTVMPAQRMASTMSMSVLDAMKMRLSFGDSHFTKNELEDLGDGGRILDHPTHHYRVTTIGTMTVTAMGQTCVNHVNTINDMWIAPDVDFGPITAAYAKYFGASVGLPDGTTQPALTTPMPKGTALKSVMRSIERSPSGQDVTLTVTNEITELTKDALDPSTFSVPSDFQTMDMRAMFSSLPPSTLDSALSAGAAASARSVCKGG
jgi:hypothetical protein